MVWWLYYIAQAIAMRVGLDTINRYSVLVPASSQKLAHCTILFLNPFNAEATFIESARMPSYFKNHSNPFILVFIRYLSLSTLRWVPICQGFSHFSSFLHHFVLATLATSSIRVKGTWLFSTKFAYNIWFIFIYLFWTDLISFPWIFTSWEF